MDLALHVADFTTFGDPAAIPSGLSAAARAAEEAGFTTLTLMDHWFQMQDMAPATDPMLDGYTALGFLAGRTERLQLGLLVTGVTYRHPGLLAKTVATLDVLSGGRALLGIGAAWYDREHAGLGVPFPPTAERFERLEETLRICAQMWGEDDGPFTGEHYQLAETLCRPRPLRPGGPRVLIGGMGERKTLRLVARYADACNLFESAPRPSSTSSPSSTGTAPRRAATRRPSPAPSSAGSTRWTTSPRSPSGCGPTRRWGSPRHGSGRANRTSRAGSPASGRTSSRGCATSDLAGLRSEVQIYHLDVDIY